jgi:hypothetical protein
MSLQACWPSTVSTLFCLGIVFALAESRPNPGERWPSRLVATPAADGLSQRMGDYGGGRRYGRRALLSSSQRRLLMWKQTDKSPFREVTINYFKWS